MNIWNRNFQGHHPSERAARCYHGAETGGDSVGIIWEGRRGYRFPKNCKNLAKNEKLVYY